MSFEKYFKFYDAENGKTLRKGQTAAFDANGKELDLTKRHRLFVTGDTALYYQLKNEPHYPQKYRSIEDALDNEHAYRAQYCLNLSSKKSENYIRRIYKRLPWPPGLSHIEMNPVPESFDFGIFAKAENLKFDKDGYFRICLELRYRKDGVAPSCAAYEPDERITIDFPEGSYDWTKLSQKVHIPLEKTALVGYWVEAYGYTGSIYIESPHLTGDNGRNIVPEFMIPTTDRAQFDWTSQHISRQEWPEFQVKINDKEVFCGEVFERCHAGSEWSFTLPAGVLSNSENKIEITYISDYHDVMPYSIHELGIIEQPNGRLDIIAVSPVGAVGSKLPVLIRTGADNVKASFSCPSGLISGQEEYIFEHKGLHGIRLDVKETGVNVDFYLTADGEVTKGTAPLLAIKEDDGVITGTGDLIYIPQDKDSLEEYLCWYLSNNAGNLVTMRPTYRWSGIRVFDEELWRDFARVLNELGMKYSLMVDGRELPGMDCNPPDSVIAGDGFLGRQMHERDGSQFYWGTGKVNSLADIQFADMGQRIFRENPTRAHTERSPNSYLFEGNDVYHYRRPDVQRDYQAGHDFAVSMLSKMRFDATRHTGVTTQFRLFIEAGYKTIGAETMYSPTEPLLSFLRGTATAYDTHFTAHLAVQWGSTPHATPDHFRRYRLALYVPYMQGASEINTEEGLWRMEEAFSKYHRFTDALIGHTKEKNDFYKYILSHTRKGHFYAPAAFIQGRLDGWHAFGNHRPWGFEGESNGEAENSWKPCLNIVYPKSNIGQILIIHGIEPDKSCGYYTGTPKGSVDVIPIESAAEIFSRYKALSFAGYNKAEEGDLDKLWDYILEGGSLLMSRAHFATQTALSSIRSYDLKPISHKLTHTDGKALYEQRSYKGKPVSVCVNPKDGYETLASCDDGTPLMIRYKIGDGYLTLLNANAYPANDTVCELYTHFLQEQLQKLADTEHTYIECGNDVQFTVYDNDDERHIYLIAVDWYNYDNTPRKATLRVGSSKYPVELRFGNMIKAVIKDNTAVYPESEMGEVLEISEDAVKVQGVGIVDFVICKDGAQRRISLDFNDNTVQMVAL